MSQRDSGYARQERDLYETPAWVTFALLSHIRDSQGIWECAAGGGRMTTALGARGFTKSVYGTDIADGIDFLKQEYLPERIDAIVTNPPYDQAQAFIQHALQLTEPVLGFVAMLLRTDYDHAKTRAHLFANCPAFAKKLVLTKRIKWFEDSKGQPSFNHAWFIWDWQHVGPPTIAYGP